MEEVNKNNGRKVLLVIIGLLIVALCCLWYFLFFNTTKTKYVFEKTIDTFADSINNRISFIEKKTNEKTEISYNLNVNFNSSNNDYKEIIKIINGIVVDGVTQFDLDNKKINSKINTTYNKFALINAEVYMDEKEVYFNLPTLYDKLIKISDVDIQMIWRTLNYKNYKTIINRMASIIKNNFKDEYFSSGKEDGLNVSAFTLKDNDAKEFYKNIINSMKKDTALLNALCDLTGKETNEIVESLSKSFDENATFNDIIISIYTNSKNEVEKIEVTSDNNKLIFNRNATKYDINIIKEGNVTNIGTIEVQDNKIDLTMNYENIIINYLLNINNNDIEMKYNVQSELLNMQTEISEVSGNGSLNISLDIPYINLNGQIKGTYSNKEISSLEAKDLTNYIDINDISENDYSNIMQKMYTSPGIMAIMQHIQNVNF